jgi:hypothetical protein
VETVLVAVSTAPVAASVTGAGDALEATFVAVSTVLDAAPVAVSTAPPVACVTGVVAVETVPAT